jgi:hypothetical protein
LISPIARHRDEPKALSRCYHIRRLELSGSTAFGRSDPDSGDLNSRLKYSTYPFVINMDFHHHRFHTASITGSFRLYS